MRQQFSNKTVKFIHNLGVQIFVALLFSALSLNATAKSIMLLTGQSNTILGSYKIMYVDENKFDLTYEQSNATFTIEKIKEQGRCCYIVRGNGIEVMYFCCQNGMGLRLVPDKYKTIPNENLKNIIDCQTLNYQSLLTPKGRETSDALGLIACFFPMVVKESANTVVFG